MLRGEMALSRIRVLSMVHYFYFSVAISCLIKIITGLWSEVTAQRAARVQHTRDCAHRSQFRAVD